MYTAHNKTMLFYITLTICIIIPVKYKYILKIYTFTAYLRNLILDGNVRMWIGVT